MNVFYFRRAQTGGRKTLRFVPNMNKGTEVKRISHFMVVHNSYSLLLICLGEICDRLLYVTFRQLFIQDKIRIFYRYGRKGWCRYRFFENVSELVGVKLEKSFLHLRALLKNLRLYGASQCSFSHLDLKQVMTRV